MAGVLNNSLNKNLSDAGGQQFAQLAENSGHSLGSLDATKVQGLLSAQGQAALHSSIAAIPAPVQPMFTKALSDFLDYLKGGFATSISHVFFVGTLLMAIAFVVTLFLPEVALRRHHGEDPVTEAGEELAVEQGSIAADNEPRTAFSKR
jgi:hypothetical protein